MAPGPVDTEQFRKECAENSEQLWLDAQATYDMPGMDECFGPLTYNLCRTALKRPVPPDSVAKSILFLASENWSGNITGQILNIDSGKQGKVLWMKDEC